MKSNLTKLSLALLSAVFILGCQDVGTGVEASDGPGPQFGKPVDGKHDHGGDDGGGGATDPTWSVTHGDTMDDNDELIVGDFIVDDIGNARPVKGKLTGIKFGTVSLFETIYLSDAFVGQLPLSVDIDACFGESGGPAEEGFGPGIEGFRGPFEFLGALRLGKGDVVTAGYSLLAKGTLGETVVGYGLEMPGTQIQFEGSAPFVPGVGETTIVEWDGVAIFHATGDAPACVGGGGAHSAQKEVNISGSVTITRN